jgi:hypothetical protein
MNKQNRFRLCNKNRSEVFSKAGSVLAVCFLSSRCLLLSALLVWAGLPDYVFADGKCSNVDCDAAKTICIASLDLDPVTCGIYYGCCYGDTSLPIGDNDCRVEPCGPGCPTDLCITSGRFGLTVEPTTITTNVAPSECSAGNLSVEVVANKEGRLFYNWWNIGLGGHGWKELEGQGRTDAAPTAALAGKYLFVVMKGIDGYLYLNQGDVSKAFVGWQRMDFQTNLPPTAASSGNLVSLVAVDKQGHIFYNSWNLGQGGSGWKELEGNGQTDVAAAAALVDNYLFVVIKGLDGYLYLNQGTLGKSFIGWQRMDFQSNMAAGASSAGKLSAVVAVDKQGRIFYDWWTLGEGGHGFKQLEGEGQTDAAPAAALIGNYLFVAIKGLDGNLYLNQGDLGKSFIGWK